MPAAVSPVKSVSGRARAFQVKRVAPAARAGRATMPPPAVRYHARGVTPGAGSWVNERSKPAYGSPGFLPAPLSNMTRTSGSFSNAAFAPA